MASGAVIDIQALVQPVSDEAPCGTDIRGDVSPGSVYYRLKDARSAARAAERAATLEDEPAGLMPEWRLILDLAPQVLAETTKDLEVAAWFIEALVRAHGLAGLRDGFEMSRQLVEGFWDGLYPLPDEDGMETRVAPFSGLNGEGGDGTLILPIRKIPLSEGEPLFSGWQYEQAVEVAQIADEERRERRLAEGALSMAQVEASFDQCSQAFLRDLLEDCDGAIAAFSALNDAFTAAAGQESPPTSNIRNRLDDLRRIIAGAASDRVMAPEAAGEADDAGETGADGAIAGNAGPAAPAGPPGAINSREQAFQTLSKVADYFRRHEPQAPTAYVIENLIRRGNMSFQDLVAELLEDAEARKRMLIAAGIKPPGEAEAEE